MLRRFAGTLVCVSHGILFASGLHGDSLPDGHAVFSPSLTILNPPPAVLVGDVDVGKVRPRGHCFRHFTDTVRGPDQSFHDLHQQYVPSTPLHLAFI
jgi:hypothetical protein